MTSPTQGSIFADQLREENEYWQKQILATPELRDRFWQPNYSSVDAYRKSLQAHRSDLRKMLGMIDLQPRTSKAKISVLEPDPVRVEHVTLVLAQNFEVRILLFVPQGKLVGAVIAVPDAQQSREEFAGLDEGGAAAWLKVLLERQFAVSIPVTVERKSDYPLGQRAVLPGTLDRRVALYRLGFIVGRTLVGLEVQQVVALRDYLVSRFSFKEQQIAMLGDRQGGMTVLYAAAVAGHFGSVAVVDYFQQREDCWNEPVDRMLYGQLNEFGDAEVVALVAPQPLHIYYTTSGPTQAKSVQAELKRARRFYAELKQEQSLSAEEKPSAEGFVTIAVKIASELGATQAVPPAVVAPKVSPKIIEKLGSDDFDMLHEYLRTLDAESDQVRADRWKLLSTPPSERAERTQELRKELAQLVGMTARGKGPLNPRTRLLQVTDKFTAYDVLLDALPGIHAYGQLLVPRRQTGRLPAVICQHGLGGIPADITGVGSEPNVYHSLGSHLANLGYVVFAPYINVPIRQEVLVNQLVREAATLGKMRTSLELAKLQRIVDFLESLPFVNSGRIGYYGLSYGGYSAIWMTPLEPRIKVDVVSGHFNDWRSKITEEDTSQFVSQDGRPYTYRTSFLLHSDADNFNWNVLNRFTHVELIAAMWPRPVCVEYGDYDTTTTPEWHSRAWKQVEQYRDAWNLGALEAQIVRVHYRGIHEIHGVGTVSFLNRWLRPEQSDERDYEYDLLEEQHGDSGLSDRSEATLPYAKHLLDSTPDTVIKGRFHVSTLSPVFSGIAVKLSRTGRPGDMVVHFGSKDGAIDLGEARVLADSVVPLFDLWYEAKIRPVRLDPSKLYFFEIQAESGKGPQNSYWIYGPKPYGGSDIDPYFGLSYRVLSPTKTIAGIYSRFHFMRPLLAPYDHSAVVIRADAAARKPNEIALTSNWRVHIEPGADEVVRTAAEDLQRFLETAPGAVSGRAIEQGAEIRLRVNIKPNVVTTAEGYRIDVSASGVTVEAPTSRGVMRGVYALEDEVLARKAFFLSPGAVVRNCRFPRRITCAVHPAGVPNVETSYPLVYNDGLLQRISHSGFNALWVWVNSEEVALDSHVFPELNNSEAAVRLARLDDLSRRSRRYGIDIYLYFATGYNSHLPESFFEKHPETRGYGWGPPMCTSTRSVRQYYAETVGTVFQRAPFVKGLIVIYDSEGFWYCGNSEQHLKQCPRCSHRTQQEVAAELLTTLDNAVHQAGGPDKELIAWNYNVASQWVPQMLSLLPKDIIVQADIDKGMDVEREGVRHRIEDYSISSLGPPALFADEYRAARAQNLTFMAKTEHAISQEFIFVPYIPCMEQWYRRNAAMREFQMGGWFGNWFFYGFTSSRAEQLLNRMSFDPVPSMDEMLRQFAERDFGREAAPYVLRAWHDFSEGIREYPYSDPVARYPGPIQRGPSQPFFLDPMVNNFGPARAWQNDLKWTEPWGPATTANHFRRVEEWYAKGNAELAAAAKVAPRDYRPAIESEWRIGRTLESSVRAALNLIDWLQARNEFHEARSEKQRAGAFAALERAALAERDNAAAILPILRNDSRLGYASDGAGVIRGGLFTPALVEWSIGELDDLLLRQLPVLNEASAKQAAGQRTFSGRDLRAPGRKIRVIQ